MKTDHDAIVVGAGPAGASTATLLAAAGWSVALVEKQPFPRRKVCGECVAASNLPLLDALGVGDAFGAAAGPALRRVALVGGSHCVVADLPPAGVAGPAWGHTLDRAWGRAIGREHLDTLLLQRAAAAGAALWQPWRVDALEGAPGAFACHVAEAGGDGRATLRAPLVVAAHGSWEPLRADRAGQPARRDGDLIAFKANFTGGRLAAGLLPVLCCRGGYGGMVRAGGGITTLACCIRRDRLAALRRQAPGAAAGEAVEAMLKRDCAAVSDALRDATCDGPWLAAGPLRPGIRLRREGQGVFLVGNAAGEAHPIIGEGMSMALQSAWLLCERLLADDGAVLRAPGGERHHTVARDYAAAWHGAFAGRIALAAAFAHIAMCPAAMATAWPLLRACPALLGAAARWSGKTRCAPDADGLAAPRNPRCLVPGSHGGGILSPQQEQALWQQVFTAQPAQRREFEPSSKRRKTRPAPWPPATD